MDLRLEKSIREGLRGFFDRTRSIILRVCGVNFSPVR